MITMELGIFGMGLFTDSIDHVNHLADSATPRRWTDAFARAPSIDAALLAPHDALSQLALRAACQAWHMAALSEIDGERVGLLVQTAWGAIDATAAYLESMFDADGRYASPRHFSRSVYSSVASIAAIHFRIHGPCQTLAFDRCPILGALRQAWRMLATRRAQRVVIIWCEQAGELAADLALKAATQLHRPEFQRYAHHGLGFGAIALVVGTPTGRRAGGGAQNELATITLNHWNEQALPPHPKSAKPFAMDSAVSLLRSLLINPTPQQHRDL